MDREVLETNAFLRYQVGCEMSLLGLWLFATGWTQNSFRTPGDKHLLILALFTEESPSTHFTIVVLTIT